VLKVGIADVGRQRRGGVAERRGKSGGRVGPTGVGGARLWVGGVVTEGGAVQPRVGAAKSSVGAARLRVGATHPSDFSTVIRTEPRSRRMRGENMGRGGEEEAGGERPNAESGRSQEAIRTPNA
jgi:hypothetical protein